MEVYAKSDIGKVRLKNEDYFYIPEEDLGIDVYIIADGMGGHKAGQVASELAVNSAKNYIKNNYEITFNESEDILKLINGAMEYANMILYEKSNEDTEFSNMGCTMDIALIIKDRIYIGHAGDSRVYRIRKNYIRKLTKDHSYVQELIDGGKIKEEESQVHPDKNMITKAVGLSLMVEPDVFEKRFIKDDILIMCSDGLSNVLTDEEIKTVVLEENKENVCNRLIDIANEKGGKDNITVIAVFG